jgi:hypothetical protein
MIYETKTTTWLKNRLTQIEAITASRLLEASRILLELHKRKEAVAGMRSGYFKFFKEIAEGKLSPEVVLGIHTPAAIPYILRLAPNEQMSLVRGGRIIIAEHDAQGQIVSCSKAPNMLTLRQWDLAIGEQGFRLFSDQKRILAKRGADVRRSQSVKDIRFDDATDELVCGRMRISLRDVRSVLHRHGYTVLSPKAVKKAA